MRIGIRSIYLVGFIAGLMFMSTLSGWEGVVSAETIPSTRSCTNLLTNHDFSGGNSGWNRYGATISSGQATLGPSYGGLEQSVNGSFSSGSDTTLEIVYSVSGGLSGTKFQLHFVDNNGNSVTREFQPTSASGTFSKTEATPTAGDPTNASFNGNTASMRIYLEAHSGATLTVDEVSLTNGTCSGGGGGGGVSAEAPIIEVANISGVSGYNIGIFGSRFGADSGSRSVTILGSTAQIVEWTDTFIRATIPAVVSGSNVNGLVVTNSSGYSSTSPFTVYTIDPAWLTVPQGSFINLSGGKPVNLSGYFIGESWCWDGDVGQSVDANTFITNYGCDYDFGAKFQADAGLGTEAAIVVDLGSAQAAGDYLFQFFSKADWTQATAGECWRSSYPHAYVIEASASGNSGSWTTALASESANLRGNRSHYFTMPAGMRYVRMRVTDSLSDCNDNIAGRDFELKEVRIYKVDGSNNNTVDSFTIYGDSLTTYAFNAHIGPADISPRVDGNTPTNFPFAPFGFPGWKATNLDLDWEEPNELEDVYYADALASSAHYWGIALGTNETNLSGVDDWGYYEPWSQFNQFDESVDNAIQWLEARGHVPILARIPDTVESDNGYGFIEAKRKILNDIDTLAARHRLIPGPDLYTEFRLNVERNGGSWFSGDGTHHSFEGSDEWIDLWAGALQSARTLRSSVPTAVAVSDASVGVSWDGIAMLATILLATLVSVPFLKRK